MGFFSKLFKSKTSSGYSSNRNDAVTSNIQRLKEKLFRPATKLVAGGFRPTEEKDESWLGKVFLFKKDEEIPTDENGDLMLPLAQLYLPTLPYCHPLLQETKLITLFVSPSLPAEFEKMGKNWVLREYNNLEELHKMDFDHSYSFLNPFPLKAELIKEDYPLWDCHEIYDFQDEIIEMENSGEIESYFDVTEHSYGHKIGGFPSYCQPGIDFGDNYEFIFQISSDPKINLNVVDSGSLMFAKNDKTGDWVVYYDFY